MTCDSLLSTELVTASGDIVTASETENPDLFWAVRGAAGGNFGVHTSFTYRVAPTTDVTVFQLSWSGGETAALVDAILPIASWRPRASSVSASAWVPIADAALPAAPLEVDVIGLYWGPPAEVGGVARPGRADPGRRTRGPSQQTSFSAAPRVPVRHHPDRHLSDQDRVRRRARCPPRASRRCWSGSARCRACPPGRRRAPWPLRLGRQGQRSRPGRHRLRPPQRRLPLHVRGALGTGGRRRS